MPALALSVCLCVCGYGVPRPPTHRLLLLRRHRSARARRLQSQQTVWAATEMKYRRRMTAMRKRNLELTEKLKEVGGLFLALTSHHAMSRHVR